VIGEPTPPEPAGYWLREAASIDQGGPCPALSGDADADVLVVGGGYTGMWTAYFLIERDPGARVILLEQNVCGGGPSGRNGGFVTGWWDELPTLVARYGEGPAVAACRALSRSINAIGEWCERHGLDVWFRRAGYLDVSACQAQDGAWEGAVELARRLGATDEYVPLSREEVAARCRSPVFRGGVLMRDGATVQPARLARGLRRVLLERGVGIYEGTPVVRFRAGPPVVAVTPGGLVRSESAVLAPGAWGARWPGLGRSLAIWGSYIVITEPAPDRLADIGWTGGECITDSRASVHYFRTTPDGRIAFGGGGGRAAWGARITSEYWSDRPSIKRAEDGFRRMFPSFHGVRLQDAWGGPIDVSGRHLPYFRTLAPGNIHVGLGYSGNGVGPSHLGGQILAALASGIEDELTTLPIVNREPAWFPPEPLRSIGARLVREAVVRKERLEEEGRSVPPVTSLVARLPRRFGYDLGPE
jgi:glycine/D-amino acid oxidase-like deaminating enzyme